MRRTFLAIALLAGFFATAAHAQMTYLDATNPNKIHYVTASDPLPVTATGTGANAAASATGATVPAFAGYTGYNSGGNLVGVSSANPLPTNCVSGCAGGTASNASSAVATSSTNGTANSWMYGYNGTTWDQLQVDGSKNLKVVLPTGFSTAANQATEIASLAAAVADLDAIKTAAQGTGPTTTGNLVAPLAMTTATTTKIITGDAVKLTYITGISLSSSAAATVSIVTGTGTNCGTGTSGDLWALDFPAGGGIAQGAGIGNLIQGFAATKDTCMKVVGTSNVKTNLTYAQQ